jgi:hypothetical protein
MPPPRLQRTASLHEKPLSGSCSRCCTKILKLPLSFPIKTPSQEYALKAKRIVWAFYSSANSDYESASEPFPRAKLKTKNNGGS